MENTPKNMALQVGALITLFVSVGSLLVLLFGIVNTAFPDAAEAYWQYESTASSIRYSIAMLVVFFPTYLVLTRKVNSARRNESSLYHSLTKWLVYFALLIGGLVILGDLVAIILAFLNGEITTRFILKASSILVVVGAAFEYYRRDAQGYWNSREKESIRYGAAASLLVLGAVVYGFMNIEAPSIVREARLDQQQLTDLQDIQWRIEAYFVENGELPQAIAGVYVDFDPPQAPENRAKYSYQTTGDSEYQLCATFATETKQSERSIAKPAFDSDYNPNNYNWEHGVGEKCFTRTVSKISP